MLPIGPLMIEHRLIERMITLIREHAVQAKSETKIDPHFVDAAVDFVRIYADRTHHGKEENILFRDLHGKQLSEQDAVIMQELIDEHKFGRQVVGELVDANKAYRNGDQSSLDIILDKLQVLADFYPEHIIKEDKVFFPASMEYLDASEKDSMLAEMWEFDKKMIHEKYIHVVEDLESQ